MKVDIDHDLKDLTKDLRTIQQRAIPQALPQAQNKVLDSVNTVAKRLISKETGLKQKNVDEKIRKKRARQGKNNAALDAVDGRAFNLISDVAKSKRKPNVFNRKLKGGKRKGQYAEKGVRAKGWGKLKVYEGSFIVRTKKGPLVAARKGKNKLKFLPGASVRQTFNKDKIQQAMRAKVKQRLGIELKRAINNEVRKFLHSRK